MSRTLKKQDGDLVRRSNGRMRYIADEEKLAQDVGDMLLTNYDPSRGTGNEMITKAANLAAPGVMDAFGDAYLARMIEDGVQRLQLMQESDPRNSLTERIDPSRTRLDIRRPNRKEFVFSLDVAPVAGTALQAAYRVRLRHQYPGKAAIQVFPVGIVTDDMVP